MMIRKFLDHNVRHLLDYNVRHLNASVEAVDKRIKEIGGDSEHFEELESLMLDRDRLAILYNYTQILIESTTPVSYDEILKVIDVAGIRLPFLPSGRFNYSKKLDLDNLTFEWATLSDCKDPDEHYESYANLGSPHDLELNDLSFDDIVELNRKPKNPSYGRTNAVEVVPFSPYYSKVSYSNAFSDPLVPKKVFLKNISNFDISLHLGVGYDFYLIPISDQLVELTFMADYSKWADCDDLKVLYNRVPSIIELYVESDQVCPDPNEAMEDFVELDHNVVVYTDQDLINAAKGAAELWASSGWGWCNIDYDLDAAPDRSPFSLASIRSALIHLIDADVDVNELDEFLTDSSSFEELTPGMWKLSNTYLRYSSDNIIKSAKKAIEDSKNNVLKLTDAEDNVFGLWAFITAVFDGVNSVELSDVKEAKQALTDHPRITVVTDTHYRLEEEDGV